MDKLWDFVINFIDHKVYSNEYKKSFDANQSSVRIPYHKEEKNIQIFKR